VDWHPEKFCSGETCINRKGSHQKDKEHRGFEQGCVLPGSGLPHGTWRGNYRFERIGDCKAPQQRTFWSAAGHHNKMYVGNVPPSHYYSRVFFQEVDLKPKPPRGRLCGGGDRHRNKFVKVLEMFLLVTFFKKMLCRNPQSEKW
jgi:hypothetical protein